jgi:subtilisin family serine protease
MRAETFRGVHAGVPGGVLGRGALSAIVEMPDAADPGDALVARTGPHFGVARGPLSALDALARAHPDWRISWSAPLRPLLDQAALTVGAPAFRAATSASGKGAYVGIIDTGVDIAHPDLRNADGTTRIAYLIDYSQAPMGRVTDAESHCTKAVPCSVLAKKDIDALLARGQEATIPGDDIGHGTHVTSLAAGNGGSEARYVGVAPEAPLIIARALDGSGQIDNATVLSAASLIFDLADRDGMPAVVNISLGTNFGPHDGTSSLERGLAEHVGPEHPGHAVVVAAGNAAGLYSPRKSPFPQPLGVHTDVAVARGSSIRVPVVTPPPFGAKDTLSGTIYVWIAFRPTDDVRVGVDRRYGEWVGVQGRGSYATFGEEGKLTVTIVNGRLSELGFDDANAAAVIIEGTWAIDETFAIRLEGDGAASLWTDASGEIGAEGALFPSATKEATITIPASHPDLIAVGATLNRTAWFDRNGDRIAVNDFGSLRNPPLETVAYFSSAGPTSDLRMKPDLVAPGAFVAGAMSRDADPRSSRTSIFFDESGTLCEAPKDCAVVDAGHAVTAGTSMAAPIVTGAVALLFDRDPTLDSAAVLTRLQAGARWPAGLVPIAPQLGAGLLDLMGAYAVQEAISEPVVREPARGESALSVGATYAHPDPDWSVPVMLKLRDADGQIADGFDPASLVVDVDQGRLAAPLHRAAPGFYRFAVAAERDTGGTELSIDVRYDGRLLVAESMPIAVDVTTSREGFSARGGCHVVAGPAPGVAGCAAALAAITAWRGRRRSRAARTARNPGRRGTSGRGLRGSSPR